MRVATHYQDHVLPAYDEYMAAENELSAAWAQNREVGDDKSAASLRLAQLKALRRASVYAIAADGLRDRWSIETGKNKKDADAELAPLCSYKDGSVVRAGCIDRVRAVANAFKHAELSDPSLPIRSEEAVVATGSGWGCDAWGVPKFGGVLEVTVEDMTGRKWVFRGDAICSLRAWSALLTNSGHSVALRSW